ncbi:MAG: hypothetical protein KGJ06_02335 [Pseudomonadota bacterium]|nr:hypothetical protein [Pseudomonadota bacterium]
MRTALLVLLALVLSACGYKGSLKSPAQIELQQEKQARKQAKESQNPSPAPPPATGIVQSPVGDQPPVQQPSMQSGDAMSAPEPSEKK